MEISADDGTDNKNKWDDVGPIQVMDFDIATPIDVKRATETLCGEPRMFYMMLGKFEDMTFLNLIGELAKQYDYIAFLGPPRYDDKAYLHQLEVFMEHAHQLKSPAGYIGASRVHYACYFIQEHFLYKRYT